MCDCGDDSCHEAGDKHSSQESKGRYEVQHECIVASKAKDLVPQLAINCDLSS
jgi:hypothetical protein